jgi:prepilin-type N-terminal cleavage/methylation domain-containing protein
MNSGDRRDGFTLIEVLIVVVIMAVLAATIIPQFTSSTKDAQTSTVDFNAHTMRAQVQLYKVQHNGTLPAAANPGTQLTTSTKADGTAGGPFGPYMDEVPANPFVTDAAKTVQFKAVTGATAGDGSTGWQYDPATGGVWPNHTGFTP